MHLRMFERTPAPTPVASPGYELFPGLGYYKLHTEGKTWQEARDACVRENAHLAIINSEAESDVIQGLFERYPCLGGPNVAAFIGFHDREIEGEFVTIFGKPLSSTGFTRWSTLGAQPDDLPPGEDCGSVHRNGGLNDFSCDKMAPYFCEKPLYSSPRNGNRDVEDPELTRIESSTGTHFDLDIGIKESASSSDSLFAEVSGREVGDTVVGGFRKGVDGGRDESDAVGGYTKGSDEDGVNVTHHMYDHSTSTVAKPSEDGVNTHIADHTGDDLSHIRGYTNSPGYENDHNKPNHLGVNTTSVTGYTDVEYTATHAPEGNKHGGETKDNDPVIDYGEVPAE